MSKEQRNLVVLGGSAAGLYTTHYILQHILPSLQSKGDASYHVYLVSSSSDFFFRVASPRTLADPSRMSTDTIFRPITEGFTQYSTSSFTFLHASATGLDTSNRIVSLQPHNSTGPQTLPYHALVLATGSRTPSPAHSIHSTQQESKDALATLSKQISTSTNIIIAGGGPTGVETAGEIGELLNGKPGWFSTPPRRATVTLITSDAHLLPTLLPKRGALAEKKLKKLGVDVVYNRRVVDARAAGSGSHTTVTLDKGDVMETDLYIPTMGVIPNSEYLPKELLNERNYVKTNEKTMRVDGAGERVYALGDVASVSRNTILDIMNQSPVLGANLKRDLVGEGGDDKVFERKEVEMMIVPIGSGGGVGAIMGWKAPSWLVWFIKGRDYMVGMSLEKSLKGLGIKEMK